MDPADDELACCYEEIAIRVVLGGVVFFGQNISVRVHSYHKISWGDWAGEGRFVYRVRNTNL